MLGQLDPFLRPRQGRVYSPDSGSAPGSGFVKNPNTLAYNQRVMANRQKSPWRKLPFHSSPLWLNLMLLAVPVAFALHFTHASPLSIFVFACIAIIPLAGLLGNSTEALAAHSGPAVGGILNATMGNAAELIIAFFALRAGHIEVVKASLSGSIIGNILLVLGLSILVGGIGREKQVFSRTVSSANSTMLFIAAIALIMPAVYDLAVLGSLKVDDDTVKKLSLWTSFVLMAVYLISFIFMLKTHKRVFVMHGHEEPTHKPGMSRTTALVTLVVATVFIAFMSEMLVGEIEAVTERFGLTELFVGVIVVAIIGNAAEHSAAILVAHRNQMDLALGIAVGSSTQIALFVAPLLVMISWILGNPMSLVFNAFELAAIVVSVLIVEMISYDGETNWFEGVLLLAVYVILGMAFYSAPG
jgi:Ca2+:H+ antiporter